MKRYNLVDKKFKKDDEKLFNKKDPTDNLILNLVKKGELKLVVVNLN